MAYKSDDLTTDLSSSLSSPLRSGLLRKGIEDSDSQGERLEDADKQILEWAAKLELESVDLREKSTELIKVLQRNSKDLTGLIRKFNEDSSRDHELKDFQRIINDFKSHFDEQINTLKTRIKDQSINKSNTSTDQEHTILYSTECVKDHIDMTQRKTLDSIVTARKLLFSLGKQLENTQDVLTSMSRDINSITERQLNLEQRLNFLGGNYEGKDHYIKCTNDLELQGTTLLNEIEDANSHVDGPVTRSISKSNEKKLKARNNNHSVKKRVGRKHNVSQARTIIPWDEIDRSCLNTNG